MKMRINSIQEMYAAERAGYPNGICPAVYNFCVANADKK